jgi:hypothetical protein
VRSKEVAPCYSQRVMPVEREPRVGLGLCGHCRHARRIESDRGSVFVRCELALRDNRFAKYPRLPVTRCAGYEEKKANPDQPG